MKRDENLDRDLVVDTDVGVALARTAFALRRALQARFRGIGSDVTVAEFGFLGLLVKCDGRRVGEVAEFMSLDRTTVTRLADGLVKKGLVQREADPEDRRAVRLSATPRGQRLFARLLPVRQAVVGRATAGLSKTRAARLRAALTEMRANLLEEDGADR